MPEILLEEPLNLLVHADGLRKDANGKLEPETKVKFGQFMTPASIASFMASLFPKIDQSEISLLDPGAGIGSLTSAFIQRLKGNNIVKKIYIDAYEIDPLMCSYLERNFDFCQTAEYNRKLSWKVFNEDFIVAAAHKLMNKHSLWADEIKEYTHCIMNPPYRKMSSSSLHRNLLRTVDIETVNLYSAFVALALHMLGKRGSLVAIIPRSFCNGPYYRPFRELILRNAAIKRIHLFGSRNKAFKDDNVLQENIIIVLEKNGSQGDVAISTSVDDSFTDAPVVQLPFSMIVKEDDLELFIHIPTSLSVDRIDNAPMIDFSLADIGMQISTGPVVDFRMKEQLRDMPEEGTVPLLYPCHFSHQTIQWPLENGKKPNSIVFNHTTEKWLYPNGFYTVVRRFSAKEEKRRIVASVIEPSKFPNAKVLGIENHLNVFHMGKKGLPEMLARGLAIFLNTTAVDDNFRRFSGHTQVNATDLKLMKYPSTDILIELGKWAMKHHDLTQEMIDEQMERITK